MNTNENGNQQIEIIKQQVDEFVVDLLHVNEIKKNKLVDLTSGDVSNTYYLTHSLISNLRKYLLDIVKDRIGKPGNTVLRGSSLVPGKEQIIGKGINDFDWVSGSGEKNPKALNDYIETVYSELMLKGNNPLFLSLGAIEWEISVNDDVVEARTPLVIFPIRLVRQGESNSPIFIEFVNDDVYLNPCFLNKFRSMAGDEVANAFPHPNGQGVDIDTPIDLSILGDGEEYFERVKQFVLNQRRDDLSSTKFKFDENIIAISQYNHDELCMYYDIKRNKNKIYNHELIRRVFNKNDSFLPAPDNKKDAVFIMPKDSVQSSIIRRVVNGESLIIKGPPGTGKTLTITNMIASLLAANKKVLLSSQKPDAMFEVYAKLPEKLRKFVMLLHSETEAQAAKLSVVEVKKDFNSLLADKKKHKSNDAIFDKREESVRTKANAVSNLRDYVSKMFSEKDVLGGSYYDALEILCKNDIEPIKFDELKKINGLSREDYVSMLADVEEAGKYYDIIDAGHGFKKSAWYCLSKDNNKKVDYESAIQLNEEIALACNELLKVANEELNSVVENYKKLPIKAVKFFKENRLALEDVEQIIDPINKDSISNVINAYETYVLCKEKDSDIVLENVETPSLHASRLSSCLLDLNLKKSEFNFLCENLSTLYLIREESKLKILYKHLDQINQAREKITLLENEIFDVFSRDLTEQDRALINENLDNFSKYVGKDSPKTFDFKTKKAYAVLKKLGYGAEISFKDIVSTLGKFSEINNIKNGLVKVNESISRLFQTRLTNNQISAIMWLVSKSIVSGQSVSVYLKNIESEKDIIIEAMKYVSSNNDYIVADLVDAYKNYVHKQEIYNAVERYCAKVKRLYSQQEAIQFAKTIKMLVEAFNTKLFGETAEEIQATTEKIYDKTIYIGEKVGIVLNKFKNFENNFYTTYYANGYSNLTFEDLEIFVKESEDRSIVNAIDKFEQITKNSSNKLNISAFFAPFIKGDVERGKYSFSEIFEHSVYKLAVDCKLIKLGNWRNGAGDRVTIDFNEWSEAERALETNSIELIENLCMSRINENDPDFAFLNAERGGTEPLRRMFKNHAQAILKLKKCFILSPSTASVFLGEDGYSDFDVVIIDEASQIKPVAIIPLLFRAKQVVMVGDENQMPPIKHFEKSNARQVETSDGEFEILNPDMSVLSYSLKNCAFPSAMFLCHYRSKTETLISFSQRRFYKEMRTFPSPMPKAEGLGFADVYIEDGVCEGGVNEAEAYAVKEIIDKHFNNYYNEETGVLSRSLGVVAFGLNQTKYIERLVNSDAILRKKIERAISNFGDVKEKLIFFKNIETVQGQETDHIILSLTYGKDKSGRIRQMFGELNKGASGNKLGECIFNVAVTRAKYAVSLVHSIKAQEITNPSVKFIADYLSIVEKFSCDGREQFVGKRVEETNGFIRSVADYLISLGIDKERIVVDYGATEGSVKIPLVILSKDMTCALMGLWCEKELGKDYDYLDYNVRYYGTLSGIGWNFVRVYAHDWVDNNSAQKERILQAVKKYVYIND